MWPHRKAGYSKNFWLSMRRTFYFHKAAKNAFNDMGVKKRLLSKVCRPEYAEVLEERKSLCRISALP